MQVVLNTTAVNLHPDALHTISLRLPPHAHGNLTCEICLTCRYLHHCAPIRLPHAQWRTNDDFEPLTEHHDDQWPILWQLQPDHAWRCQHSGSSPWHV